MSALRIAAGTTAVVAAAAAILSWDALRWAALQSGVDPRLAWLWPVAVDGAIATGTIAALALRRARLRVRTWSWTVLGSGVVVSLVGNASHAAAGNPLHRIAAAVPALALAASLHLLVVLAREGSLPARTTARVAAQRSDNLVGLAREPARAVARARLTALVSRQPDLGPAEVARRFGVSRSTAKRWLSQARRPAVEVQ